MTGSASLGRPLLVGLATALAGIGVSRAAAASCAGPCLTPQFWNLQVSGGELEVTANFGILARGDAGWQVVCEEAIGGILLSVHSDARARFASTINGLFTEDGAACEYAAVTIAQSSDWLLDFALPAEAGGATSERYALIIEQPSEAVQVLRAAEALEFEVVATFEPASGYRELTVGGAPAAVYATGYTFGPRVWRVAFSLDGGDVWTEVAPEFDDPDATLVPVAVDPAEPGALWLRLQTPSNEPAELWRFDAESERIERVHRFASAESFAGFAVGASRLYAAGIEDGVGSLYAADRDEQSFEPIVTGGPAFACLAASSETLYTCTNDFTRDSEYLVASSDDEGQSWEPVLVLEDLGTVESCDERCVATTDWLHATFGVPSQGSGGAGGTGSGGFGAATPDSEPSGGCRLATLPGRSSDTGVLFLALLLLHGLRARRAFPARVQRDTGPSCC